MRSGTFPLLMPLAVIVAVAAVILGLGALFSVAGEGGTMGIGLGIILGALAVGFLLTRERKAVSPAARPLPRLDPRQMLLSPITVGRLLFKVEPNPLGGGPSPLRHRVHRFFTEGPGGLLRCALLDLLLLGAGTGIVFGADLANGVLERGYGFNTWMGFAVGVTFVCVVNAVLYLIALDYREEKFRREEVPLIWHKE